MQRNTELLEKMKRILTPVGDRDHDSELYYVVEMYERGASLYDICNAIVTDGWDGNPMSSSLHGLADAYMKFYDGCSMDKESRLYLLNRGGFMGSYLKSEGDEENPPVVERLYFTELIGVPELHDSFMYWLKTGKDKITRR